jgi:hypothetical protein
VNNVPGRMRVLHGNNNDKLDEVEHGTQFQLHRHLHVRVRSIVRIYLGKRVAELVLRSTELAAALTGGL